jgi:hypothetical protein
VGVVPVCDCCSTLPSPDAFPELGAKMDGLLVEDPLPANGKRCKQLCASVVSVCDCCSTLPSSDALHELGLITLSN